MERLLPQVARMSVAKTGVTWRPKHRPRFAGRRVVMGVTYCNYNHPPCSWTEKNEIFAACVGRSD